MAEIRVKGTGTIKLFESDNTSSVTIASPASLSADKTITLPDADVTLVSGTMVASGNVPSFGGDTFGADKTIGANDAYALSLETSGNVAIKMDAAGIVTKPLQPAFSAHVTSNVDPGSTSDYNVPYATEIFDTNADYNNSTYTFTAPVTGRYLFSTRVQGYDVATSFSLAHSVVTSNRTYHGGCGRFYDTDQYYTIIVSLADMDASDTAIVVVNSSESSFYISSYSYFNGYLAC